MRIIDVSMETPFKAGDVVRANYTFRKDKNEDLSFKRNDTLQIINVAKDPNWAHAKNSLGETGLIPLNYVELCDFENTQWWFHGRISRVESENLLAGHPLGSFLVRDSDQFVGDLTLCVVGPSLDVTVSLDRQESGGSGGSSGHPTGMDQCTNVQHYRIIRKRFRSGLTANSDKLSSSKSGRIHYSLDEQDWFLDLSDLIQYYSVPNRGLVHTLVHPVQDRQRKRLEELRQSGRIISRKELVLGDRLGRGEFGEVLKATYQGRQVAVKIYKKTASKLAITYEASLMSKLDHPNLISFVGLVYEPDDHVYLVTEYLSNGSLLTYLHSRTCDEITQTTKLRFSIDSCRGLTYLEEHGLIHRDIAARNILLSGQIPNLIAKVGDFGMARDLHDLTSIGSIAHNPTNTLPVLTIHTPPPGGGGNTNGSEEDVLFASTPPDHHHNPTPSIPNLPVLHDNAAIPLKWTAPEAVRDRLANQVLRHIESGYRMKAPEDCPGRIYDLMLRTWQIDPIDRPTFADILDELLYLLNTLPSSDNHPNHTNSVGLSRLFDPTQSSAAESCHVRHVRRPIEIVTRRESNRMDSQMDKTRPPVRRSSRIEVPRNLAELIAQPIENHYSSTKPTFDDDTTSDHHHQPHSMSRSFTITTSTTGTDMAQIPTAKTPDGSTKSSNTFRLPRIERLQM